MTFEHKICWKLHITYWKPHNSICASKVGTELWEKTRHILDHKALLTMHCSVVLLYHLLNIWNTLTICFLKSHALKFRDLVELNDVQSKK